MSSKTVKRRNRTNNEFNRVERQNDKMKSMVNTDRLPATEADWLAGQLHEARANNCELRTELFDKELRLIEKDQKIIELRKELQTMRADRINKATQEIGTKNAELREKHGLLVGRTLRRDDDTGEVYWEVEKTASETN